MTDRAALVTGASSGIGVAVHGSAGRGMVTKKIDMQRPGDGL